MLPTITLPTVNTGRFAFGKQASKPTGARPLPIDPSLLNDVYTPHLHNDASVQIIYGGSSSGKSVFISQRAVWEVASGGRNYLITRAVARTIRHSVFNEIQKATISLKLDGRFKINKSEMSVTCDNGYQILFAGMDDTEKLKSITPAKGVITDIWIEEATESTPDDIKQLEKRLRGGDPAVAKRLHLTFNPILQSHHIYTTYFARIAWTDDQTEYNDGRLSILKTWYIHNRFLTPDDIERLENEGDEYYRNVYTFGNWGVLGDVIFTNWETADLSEMRNQFTNRRAGLDFGFSSDPAALAVTHYDKMRKTIYIYQELYERGLTNDMLAGEIKTIDPACMVVCDSAEPKSITELRQHGIMATGAQKGKDSVNFGIQWLQQQRIVIDKSCVNARNEFQQYQWKKDRDGNALRIPVDKNNHVIDALRYAYESEAFEAQAVPNPFYD